MPPVWLCAVLLVSQSIWSPPIPWMSIVRVVLTQLHYMPPQSRAIHKSHRFSLEMMLIPTLMTMPEGFHFIGYHSVESLSWRNHHSRSHSPSSIMEWMWMSPTMKAVLRFMRQRSLGTRRSWNCYWETHLVKGSWGKLRWMLDDDLPRSVFNWREI